MRIISMSTKQTFIVGAPSKDLPAGAVDDSQWWLHVPIGRLMSRDAVVEMTHRIGEANDSGGRFALEAVGQLVTQATAEQLAHHQRLQGQSDLYRRRLADLDG